MKIKTAHYELIRNEGAQAADFPWGIALSREFHDGSTDCETMMLVKYDWEARQMIAGLNAMAEQWIHQTAEREAFAGGIH